MIQQLMTAPLQETRKRLFAHSDYFGYIIPSSFFLASVLLAEFAIFGSSFSDYLRTRGGVVIEAFRQYDNVALELALVVVVLLLTFNCVYVVGHVLNAVSALVFDSGYVGKMLKYPFRLYCWKLRARAGDLPEEFYFELDSEISDRAVFRYEVLNSTYFTTCLVNLPPWIFAVTSCLTYLEMRGSTANLFSAGFAVPGGVVVGIALLHLGFPGYRIRTLKMTEEGRERLRHARTVVAISWVLVTAGVTVWVYWSMSLLPVVVFWVLNAGIVVFERFWRASHKGGAQPATLAEDILLYLRMSFLNWVYFVAKLVGYTRMPSSDVLERALRFVDLDEGRRNSNDFHWLSNIAVTNLLPSSFRAMYQFLSMYGMNRNLCNACGALGFYLVARYFFGGSLIVDEEVFLLVLLSIWLLVSIFFARYLYFYAGYYSRYLVRAVGFLGYLEELGEEAEAEEVRDDRDWRELQVHFRGSEIASIRRL